MEIVPLDSGIWEEGEGESDFDSFAWLGEWDGLGNHQDPFLASRVPTMEELHTTGIQAPIVLELSGSDAAGTVGQWHESGSSLVCLGRRGWIEFDLEIDLPGVFLIELEGREHNSFHETISSFDLKFYLEGEYLGTRVLEAVPGNSGTVYVFSPWLENGSHRLRILWDGSRSWRNLQVETIRLRTIVGTDTSENGIQDWVEDRLVRFSGTDPQPSMFTYVSPLALEGRDRFNSSMRIENIPMLEDEPGEHREVARTFLDHPRGGGRDFQRNRVALSPEGNAVSIDTEPHYLSKHGSEWAAYLSRWSEPASFAANRGPGYRFRSDVPLAPLVDNAITLSWQGGVAEERRMVRWVPYNILEGGGLVLRIGDSMLLTAHEGNQQSGQVLIDVKGNLLSGLTEVETFATNPASPLVYTFKEAGEYLIEGSYIRSNGQQYSGALSVSVREFSFTERPLIYVGRERGWKVDVDGGADHGLRSSFEADPRLGLVVSGGASDLLKFGTNNNVFKTIVARAEDGGSSAILDSVEAEAFRLFSSWETYATVVDTLPDGTKLVEMMMILSPVPADVKVRLEIFVGGILFDDGTIERWLMPEDFDELGQVIFRFIMPEEAISSVCHRTYVYQNDTLIGIR